MKHTIEDLLKVVESNKTQLKKPRNNVSDIHKFIEELDIKEGKHRVKVQMVYKAYKLWGGKKTSKSFFNQFSKYFERLRTGHDFVHYCLNVRAVELLNKVDNGLVEI
jgi:hypothetical protein